LLRRSIALALLALLASPSALAQGRASQHHSRPASEGIAYVGTGPGFNVGGHALPRSLYMDFIHGGYIFPSGLDASLAFSGMNFFPNRGEYAVSMARASVGFRPFMRDPLPMIQPYGFLGLGFGGEGRYVCEPEPRCDPSKDVCTDTCSRADWAMNGFLGVGADFNTFLFYVGSQQVLLYAGVQARYEFLNDHHMPVFMIPIGLRIQ